MLILDDLLKSRQEAESEIIRQSTWDAVNDDLLTRLEPGGAVVLMATRWHEDDPTGRMIKLIQNPDVCNGPVVILNLVAMPETEDEVEQDPLHRPLFGSIWPERYSTRVLKATRDRLGPYSWGALYKGKPTPHEGGLFKRANFNRVAYVNPNEIVRTVRFWDLAMSEKTSADYTVGVKMAMLTTGRTAVLDVARRQLEWEHVPGFIAETALRDGPSVTVGFESKGYMSRAGKALVGDPRLHMYGIFGYPKDTDKLTNALPFAARVGEQMVDIVDSYFTETFLDELCSFPVAAHDDQVDAAAGAWEMLGVDPGDGDLNLYEDDGFGIV